MKRAKDENGSSFRSAVIIGGQNCRPKSFLTKREREKIGFYSWRLLASSQPQPDAEWQIPDLLFPSFYLKNVFIYIFIACTAICQWTAIKGRNKERKEYTLYAANSEGAADGASSSQAQLNDVERESKEEYSHFPVFLPSLYSIKEKEKIPFFI